MSRDILSKCDLPMPEKEILKLIGVPFKDWPSKAKEPWKWNGRVTPERYSGGRFHRARARVRVGNRRMSPAILLWEMFTGVKLQPGQKIAFRVRGVRGVTEDNLNPFFYQLLIPRPKVKQPRTKKPKPIKDVANLMASFNYYPSTVEELLVRWPELSGHSKEDLNATIRFVSLS